VARSTRRDDRPGPESEGGRIVLALVLGLAVLGGGVYSAAYAMAGDKVPVGTTVAGVDIGGHDPSSAAEVLRAGLESRASTPFTVVIGRRRQQVRPSQVGLAVDYSASVGKAAAQRSWRPSHLWRYYTNGLSFQPVVTLDQNRLASLLRRLDFSDGRSAKDGAVVFRRDAFTVRSPHPGFTIDPRSAGMAFWNAYLSKHPTVRLPLTSVQPTIDSAAIHRFVRRFANPAMASAVQLQFGSASVHLSPADYGHLLVAQRVGNRLRPAVQDRGLLRLTRSDFAGSRRDHPRPATVALVDGAPHVVAARPGVRFRSHDIGQALLHAIDSRHRTARVRPTTARASFTTADARRLAVRRQLAHYTVRLPAGGREAKLTDLAGRLDGALLKPGQSLSLRHRLGADSASGASGDTAATALFNAAWLGGLQVTSHASAATYAGSGPVGRDASLHGGHDLTIKDDTRYGVLVAATASHGSLTVTLWSTPRWTVTSRHSAPSHVVKAGRDVVHSPDCTPRQGRNGFDVTVTRSFASAGHVDHTSSYTVHYRPVDALVCRSGHHGHQPGHHHHHHHH
jgi:vancomycin resistance protein YoaR